jgi:hypothetical protein
MVCSIRCQVCCNIERIAAGIGASESGARPPTIRLIGIRSATAAKIFWRVGSKPQHQLHMGSWTYIRVSCIGFSLCQQTAAALCSHGIR